jgi:hypothetical protein
MNGQFRKLIAPLDANDNFCGFAEYADYPYMYLTDFDDADVAEIFVSGVCVKECPTTAAAIEQLDCKVNDMIGSCEVEVEKRYVSSNYAGYCLPKDFDSAPDSFKVAYTTVMQQLSSSSIGSIFVDVYNAQFAILISIATAIVICLVYTYLMSTFSEPLAWLCVFMIWAGLIAASVGCWYMRA